MTRFLLAAVAALAGSAAVTSAARACNGYEDLCNRRYNEVAYATTHNSFATGTSIAANQNDRSIKQQLTDGIRGLMLDLHSKDEKLTTRPIEMCHTSCFFLDAGTFLNTLNMIKEWMDNNPNEVVSLLLENYTRFDPQSIAEVFKQAGLDSYAWIQPNDGGKADWPTLGEMIDQKKRLVVFSDPLADQSIVPYIMPQFTYAFETPYEVAAGAPFPCTVLRPANGQANKLMTLNHFNYITTEIVGRTIQAPNPSGADAANTLDSFHAQLQQCKTNGLVTDTRIPNFIAVDFYDKGAVFQFVAELNRVQQKSPRSSAMSPPLSSSASLAAFAGFAVAAATLF